IRVRSPLLTESPLFSLPAGTEMFHFPTFPPTGLYIQPAVTHKTKAMHAGFPHSDILASPFGYQLHQARSDEHTSELQSRFDLVSLLPFPTRRSSDLIRVRSPLLTDSPLFSLPAGTEMFHFPTFPPTGLYIQPAVTHKTKAMHAGFPHSDILASPFGYQLHLA